MGPNDSVGPKTATGGIKWFWAILILCVVFAVIVGFFFLG